MRTSSTGAVRYTPRLKLKMGPDVARGVRILRELAEDPLIARSAARGFACRLLGAGHFGGGFGVFVCL